MIEPALNFCLLGRGASQCRKPCRLHLHADAQFKFFYNVRYPVADVSENRRYGRIGTGGEHEHTGPLARLHEPLGAQSGNRFTDYGSADPETLDEDRFSRKLVPYGIIAICDFGAKRLDDMSGKGATLA
ncbi:hypothetical protein GCM10011491_12040 [Brucella endophytica]|uniref:Uncharacterized protein n=1 Tax=Brucella endophytica TaxID=1963359 RepID=A0A916WBN8_9HYPH|nr:hypothetical protein GCM10011491_12040 [Brucella endophytica]